jgi:gentisate 1,2-dioxygenase
VALADDNPAEASVQITYVNPDTGTDVENILGFYAMMLRPGQTLNMPARSPACVFHLIEGQADVNIEGQNFALVEADTCCAPGYTPVTVSNRSNSKPAFFFLADEAPLHRKLGVYEVRA